MEASNIVSVSERMEYSLQIGDHSLFDGKMAVVPMKTPHVVPESPKLPFATTKLLEEDGFLLDTPASPTLRDTFRMATAGKRLQCPFCQSFLGASLHGHHIGSLRRGM